MEKGSLVNVTFSDGHVEKGTILDICKCGSYIYRVLIYRRNGDVVVFCQEKDLEPIKEI